MEDLNSLNISSYSYHGHHNENPRIHFIRFDFEPFKTKYAPIHINTPKEPWGDHLTFPDSTNLDISKMSCAIALKVFNRYAINKDDYPVNTESNMEYQNFFEE